VFRLSTVLATRPCSTCRNWVTASATAARNTIDASRRQGREHDGCDEQDGSRINVRQVAIDANDRMTTAAKVTLACAGAYGSRAVTSHGVRMLRSKARTGFGPSQSSRAIRRTNGNASAALRTGGIHRAAYRRCLVARSAVLLRPALRARMRDRPADSARPARSRSHQPSTPRARANQHDVFRAASLRPQTEPRSCLSAVQVRRNLDIEQRHNSDRTVISSIPRAPQRRSCSVDILPARHFETHRPRSPPETPAAFARCRRQPPVRSPSSITSRSASYNVIHRDRRGVE